ncbi:hypothetical protein [uncultured Spirosoma sp.]|uniref:hypothetical protein n=1 Tax=uncultured Spirosoma sp. TaxID=278208 RepID=UPI00258C7210|nr:hypothetical protein [uncultured Spirosoma sp.]
MGQSLLTGIAPVVRPGVATDSAGVARQFVHNAKPILDSLTALHFARIRIGRLQLLLDERTTQRDQSAAGFVSAQTQLRSMSEQLTTSRLELGTQRRRLRAKVIEVWLWRIGATYLLYRKICPSCPP